MGLTELRVEHTLPEWTLGFLRARCTSLQRSLLNPGIVSLDGEEDSIHCWRLLLLAAAELSPSEQEALDELHLLHAQLAERMERGGVGDISEDVEFLIRTILIDRLQRLTDHAAEVLSA